MNHVGNVVHGWHESMHVLFCLSILFKFFTPTTMTLPSSYSSSKQNNSPHQQRRKQLKWRCAAALVLPSGSHHGARRTSAVYSMAACLDHHRCKTSVHSNDSHLGADIPRPPNMASTVPSSHRFMGQRCQDAALQIWNLFLVRREKNSRKSQAPNCRCKLQNTSKTLEKFEKLKGVQAVGELFSWTKESEIYGSARMPRENVPLLEKQLVQTPRALLFGSSCG